MKEIEKDGDPILQFSSRKKRAALFSFINTFNLTYFNFSTDLGDSNEKKVSFKGLK